VPILVLVAQHDRVIGGAQTRTIAALLPHATIKKFDAPHLLLQARPEQAAAAIAEFVG
jgi:pimeloyl-ACP methyl ester carboxylesterase